MNTLDLPIQALRPHQSEAAQQRAKRLALGKRLQNADSPLAQLRWEDLCACPEWLCWTEQALHTLAVRAAGGWWVAAIQSSIDGRALSVVQQQLGPSYFQTLRSSEMRGGATAGLPDVARCEAEMQGLGQRLLIWSLPSGLQQAMADELHWAMPQVADAFDAQTVHAMWAIEQALSEVAA